MIRGARIAALRVLLLIGAVASTLRSPSLDAKPRDWGDSRAPVISHVRVATAVRGKPLTIRARFDDESEIFAPAVYVRPLSAKQYSAISMRQVEEGYQAIVPADWMEEDLDYFIEAFDEHGNGPTREGTPQAPIRVAVTAADASVPTAPSAAAPAATSPQASTVAPSRAPRDTSNTAPGTSAPTPLPPAVTKPPSAVAAVTPPPADDDGLAKQWWFWTMLGVAVVGAGVTIAVISASGDPVQDQVSLRVRGPDYTEGP